MLCKLIDIILLLSTKLTLRYAEFMGCRTFVLFIERQAHTLLIQSVSGTMRIVENLTAKGKLS